MKNIHPFGLLLYDTHLVVQIYPPATEENKALQASVCTPFSLIALNIFKIDLFSEEHFTQNPLIAGSQLSQFCKYPMSHINFC